MKNSVMAERGRKGGIATRDRYGKDHFRRLQQLSWAAQIQANPKAGMKLGHAGLRAIDPAPENAAWTREDWK